MELPSYNIADLAPPDIQAYLAEKDIVMIPIASLEQHEIQQFLDRVRLGQLANLFEVDAFAAPLELREIVVAGEFVDQVVDLTEGGSHRPGRRQLRRLGPNRGGERAGKKSGK